MTLMNYNICKPGIELTTLGNLAKSDPTFSLDLAHFYHSCCIPEGEDQYIN